VNWHLGNYIFLNVPSIQNYIDKGAIELIKPKPAYFIDKIVWLNAKVL
jgi:hypothetical protein